VSDLIEWLPWDPVHCQRRAPASRFRVCAFHIDFDERPTCYVDVATLERAEAITMNLSDLRAGRNVDYATIYDDQGEHRGHGPW